MIIGRASVIAKTFEKYRFNKFTLNYVSNQPSNNGGELYMTYVSDPSLDPTKLTDRQLKVYFDSIPKTFSGNVAVESRIAMCSFNLNQGRTDKLYTVLQDQDDIQDVYQGKFVFGASATLATVLGDIYLEYEMDVVDAVLSINDILRMRSQNSPYSWSTPSSWALNDNVVSASTTLPATAPEGVYSAQAKQDAPGGLWGDITSFVDKLYQFGSEFIANVVGPTPGTKTITFFDSIADWISGNPTKYKTANTSAGPIGLVTEFVPLLFDAINNNVDPVFMSGMGELKPNSFRLTKGWAVSVRNAELANPNHRYDWDSHTWVEKDPVVPSIANTGAVRIPSLDYQHFANSRNSVTDTTRHGTDGVNPPLQDRPGLYARSAYN